MKREPSENPRLLTRTLAERAHTRRVAAWCAGIATKLNLPAREQDILERAARLHQRSKLFADEAAWTGLRRELGLEPGRADEISEAAIETLRSLHGHRSANERIRKLAAILEQSDDLDGACELDATVSSEQDLNGLDGIVELVGGYFGGVSSADIEQAAGRLPVFSGVVHRAIALLGNVNTNFADLESVISADPTLAGHIVSAANSALLGSAVRTKTIQQSVVRMGMEAARQIISAAALRKLFDAKHSHALWNHSLDVAESAANLARRSGLVDPEEAFLAGLMHDVGRLVVLNLPAETTALHDRLTENGCPRTIVERVTLGRDHAWIGAQVLRQWRFAESTIAAIEHHHAPENNTAPLCSVLYLAEAMSDQDPGLESMWREELARKNLWLPMVEPELGTRPDTMIATLRFATAA